MARVVLCFNLIMGGVYTSPMISEVLSGHTESPFPDTQAHEFTSANQNGDESTVNGYKFSRGANTWLRLHTVPASWADADRQCRLEGGVLASPKTRALTQAMLAMMATEQLAWYDSVFTAVSKTTSTNNDSEGNFGSCVVMTGEGKVDYEPCASERPFFCLKNQFLTGYEWSPRTASWYKFHHVAKSWHGAAKTCLGEGAHLAIINSDEEDQVLRDIFERNPRDTIVGANNAVVAIVGFWKWDSGDGEWMTIHGETLAEAGFERWSTDPPQPDNAGGNEYCGAILRTALLNDIPCNEKPFAFICEINPNPNN